MGRRTTLLRGDSGGFTLMEVIIAVAIVALMAGALAPVVFKQINSARSKVTVQELDQIESGLLSFYQDTGRFPTEAEGLEALVSDPGLANWQGPYLSSAKRSPAEAIKGDAFGMEYIYDLNPVTDPPGSADVLVASGGADLTPGAGRLNRTWDLESDTDDIFTVVSAAAIERTKENEAREELQILSAACSEYYRDNSSFPTTLSELSGVYLDSGFAGGIFEDAWKVGYRTIQYGGGGAVTLMIYSCGPDRRDDSGGGDDLSLLTSSIPPGRITTRSELDIAQAALTRDPEFDLTGSWTGAAGIRARLGLAEVFDLDGWGNSYRVNIGSRLIFSCGPDGRAATVSDNLPTGVGQ